MAKFVVIDNIMVNLDTVTMVTPNTDRNYTNIYFISGTSRVVKSSFEEAQKKIFLEL